MNKLKYILRYSISLLIGVAITLPITLSVISANTDLSSSTLDSSGNLTIDGGNSSETVGTVSSESAIEAIEKFETKMFMYNLFNIFKMVITGVTGILSIIYLGIFCFKISKALCSGDSLKDAEKNKNVNKIIYSGIGALLLGLASLSTGVAFGFFNI